MLIHPPTGRRRAQLGRDLLAEDLVHDVGTVVPSRGEHPERTRDIRWIYLHMIEEYARLIYAAASPRPRRSPGVHTGGYLRSERWPSSVTKCGLASGRTCCRRQRTGALSG
jgi:hypothetical protein